MFERRLRVFLFFLLLAGVVVVIRLVELQVVRGDYYRQRARRSLLVRPKPLPFVRGRILDRRGEVLVREEASWAITVDYPILSVAVESDPAAMKKALVMWRRRFNDSWEEWRARFPDRSQPSITGVGSGGARVEVFREEIADAWMDIARLSASHPMPRSVTELRDKATEICNRIERIRDAVAARRGFDSPVAEETTRHPVLTGLSAREQIDARELLGRYPWVHVDPQPVRRYVGDSVPLAHVLGRVGRVDASAVRTDPHGDDPFAAYRPDEVLGISGAEFVAEQTLRGRRGRIRRDRHGGLVEPVIEAENGRDAVLTLHAGLQRRLYRILGETVEATPESSGGAIVVLDVPSREVLALVSYPSYDPGRFVELFPILRDDTDRLPLRFRPVQNAYAPGSTVKPLVCLAGLIGGHITLDTHEICTGYLFEDARDRWRCWKLHGTSARMAHGSIDVLAALRGSCNVFMYRLGQKIGVDGLTGVFDMVGVGRTTGIGLKEERAGINPTPSWLLAKRNRPVYPGHARLFAIGQGEMLMTPLQVANMMAVYASGRYAPVTLVRGDGPKPQWTLPGEPRHWAAIRQGVYEVVNDPNGTAYEHAHFIHDRFALCGKTGSATAHRWPTSYRIPYTDAAGRSKVTLIHEGAKGPAIKRFVREFPEATFDPDRVEVASTWPTAAPSPGERYSHAWFGGFLQPLAPPTPPTGGVGGARPDFSREATIAFSVLVEFGGSGGRTSGPLAKRVAAETLKIRAPGASPVTRPRVPQPLQGRGIDEDEIE